MLNGEWSLGSWADEVSSEMRKGYNRKCTYFTFLTVGRQNSCDRRSQQGSSQQEKSKQTPHTIPSSSLRSSITNALFQDIQCRKWWGFALLRLAGRWKRYVCSITIFFSQATQANGNGELSELLPKSPPGKRYQMNLIAMFYIDNFDVTLPLLSARKNKLTGKCQRVLASSVAAIAEDENIPNNNTTTQKYLINRVPYKSRNNRLKWRNQIYRSIWTIPWGILMRS